MMVPYQQNGMNVQYQAPVRNAYQPVASPQQHVLAQGQVMQYPQMHPQSPQMQAQSPPVITRTSAHSAQNAAPVQYGSGQYNMPVQVRKSVVSMPGMTQPQSQQTMQMQYQQLPPAPCQPQLQQTHRASVHAAPVTNMTGRGSIYTASPVKAPSVGFAPAIVQNVQAIDSDPEDGPMVPLKSEYYSDSTVSAEQAQAAAKLAAKMVAKSRR